MQVSGRRLPARIQMASQAPETDKMVEPCANCGRDTPHTVAVELWTESAGGENASFSREPYRVAECQNCGEEFVQRMSNA